METHLKCIVLVLHLMNNFSDNNSCNNSFYSNSSFKMFHLITNYQDHLHNNHNTFLNSNNKVTSNKPHRFYSSVSS